jgi:vancomycin permeability regulator SanA
MEHLQMPVCLKHNGVYVSIALQEINVMEKARTSKAAKTKVDKSGAPKSKAEKAKSKKAKPKKSRFTRILLLMLIAGVICIIAVFCIDGYVKASVSDKILTVQQASQLDADCIVVLGALVRTNETPSYILQDRLDRGIELYNLRASDRILMSGDHGRVNYDEVNVMKQYAIDTGIPSQHVFMDHAGFSTYESFYRARDIFLARKVIIVTQEYHLYRSLYIAEKLGLEAYGVAAAGNNYSGQPYRDFREMLARVKDFFYVIFKPEPKYLGETIPVSGNGDLTNDKS